MTVQDAITMFYINQIIFGFWFIAGLLCSGFFEFIVDAIIYRFQRPKRIKFASLNVSDPSFDYLYRWKGRYYTHEQYQFVKRGYKNSFSSPKDNY